MNNRLIATTPATDITSFLTYTSLLGQQGGGTSTPSNWWQYPAGGNVEMSNNPIKNGYLDYTGDLSGNLAGKPLAVYSGNIPSSNSGQPVFQTVQTNGGGVSQPADYTAMKHTYIKNDPFGNANEIWSLITRYDTGSGQWTMGAVWEGYIALPFTIGGAPITFSVGGNDTQQLYISSTNGGSGALWVDSNGALYWNSNLVANP
jgi:hypothetical protein